MIIKIINTILDKFCDVAMVVLGMLPESPFFWDLGGLGNIFGFANYFIPFASMLTLMTSYVSAVAIWYAVRWVLRIIRYIE
jgi:hypothetical protein